MVARSIEDVGMGRPVATQPPEWLGEPRAGRPSARLPTYQILPGSGRQLRRVLLGTRRHRRRLAVAARDLRRHARLYAWGSRFPRGVSVPKRRRRTGGYLGGA